MLSDFLEKSESEIQKYLEEHDEILQVSVGTANWYHNYVLPHLSLGSDGGIPDFVIVSGQSNSFWIHIVELKLPSAQRFTNKDSASKDLREAIDQVLGYAKWAEDNKDYFKKILLDAVKTKYPEFDEDFQNNRRFIICKDLIIGRRNDLNDNRSYCTNEMDSFVRIISYDRLIENEIRLEDMRQKNVDKHYFELDDCIRMDLCVEMKNKFDYRP